MARKQVSQWIGYLLAVALLLLFSAQLARGEDAIMQIKPTITLSEEGTLLKNGEPYRAFGINFFSAFARVLQDPGDTTYREGFVELASRNIPFVRFMAGGFWPVDWKLYQEDREAYFERMDDVVRAAEETGIGLIPSLFWYPASVSDVVGEPRNRWGNPSSKTHAFMREYVREVVTRYRDSPAIWIWEFGNEFSLSCDLPNAAEHRPKVVPHLGANGPRSEEDDLTHDMVLTAVRCFAEEVRKYDPVRPITTGHSIPRSSAEHQRHEGTWASDSREEFRKNLIDSTPDPIDIVSIHLYPFSLQHRFGQKNTSWRELLGFSQEVCRQAGKVLFVGEFGACTDVPSEDKESVRRRLNQMMAAVELSEVPLAALWVYDLGQQEDTWNVTPTNSRAYMLDLLSQANRRIGYYMHTKQPHKIDITGGGFAGRLLDSVVNRNRSGNGFNPVCHERFPDQNLYRDDAIGFYFEHIFNGMAADRENSFFSPNRDPHVLRKNSDSSASLIHTAERSTWGVESELSYTFSEPGAIDIEFQATLTEDRFGMGYCAFMWACYMNRTRERSYHFWGHDGEKEGWISFGEDTDEGFETGTVSFLGVPDLPYEKGAQTLNILEHPTKKFVLPFYYGLVDGDGDLETTDDTMAYIMMFDQKDPIRFALWNFIRNSSGNPDPHSPAWDWQYVVRDPEIGKKYGYRARLLYKPFVDAEDVRNEYDKWVEGLGSENTHYDPLPAAPRP